MLNKISEGLGLKSKKSKEPNFFLEITGAPVTEVVKFSGSEDVSNPYEFNVKLASATKMNFGDVIEKEALLTVKGGEMDRYFHGVIRRFKHAGKNTSRKYLYWAQIVPYFSLLSLEKDCRIFQNMNVQDIIAQIFEESGITSDLYEFRFSNKSRLRKYCVQHNENDKEFIERLLQEEGIFYFFEHHKDKHVMIFGEDRRDYVYPECDNKIKFMAASGMNETEECVNFIEFSNRLTPGAYSHTNFNFKMPSADIRCKDVGKEESLRKYEVYEYPGLYGEINRGELVAKNQLKSHQAFSERASGSSKTNRLMPGYMFNLINHDFSTFNKEYVAISVTHSVEQSQTLEEDAEGGTNYFNTFFAIPSSVNYTPLRTIKKPLMRGPQTAIVVGKDGDEICTDEYGRVKVQFHWDRKGENNEKSSCWIRCAQLWGGGGWGTLFTPRVGDEVLVDFVNGDPDYPIIVGSIYNGDDMPLYPLPANMTRTTIKTRSTPNSDGYNELRFEDKAGSEEVYLQSEKDWNILIKNDKGQNVGHDENLTVGNNRTKTVGANQEESIGATKKETVTLDSYETVGLMKALTTGGLYQVTVGAAMNETVIGAKTEEVGLVKGVFVAKDMTEQVKGNRNETVGKEYSISTGDSMTITCGNSSITMDKSGNIKISGAQLALEASGPVTVNGQVIKLN